MPIVSKAILVLLREPHASGAIWVPFPPEFLLDCWLESN